jgi:hypothetical protein
MKPAIWAWEPPWAVSGIHQRKYIGPSQPEEITHWRAESPNKWENYACAPHTSSTWSTVILDTCAHVCLPARARSRDSAGRRGKNGRVERNNSNCAGGRHAIVEAVTWAHVLGERITKVRKHDCSIFSNKHMLYMWFWKDALSLSSASCSTGAGPISLLSSYPKKKHLLRHKSKHFRYITFNPIWAYRMLDGEPARITSSIMVGICWWTVLAHGVGVLVCWWWHDRHFLAEIKRSRHSCRSGRPNFHEPAGGVYVINIFNLTKY